MTFNFINYSIYIIISIRTNIYVSASVSHTDHDLVFIWNMTDPLVVNPEIELPQLDISNNYTTDCTIEYSTGEVFFIIKKMGQMNNSSTVVHVVQTLQSFQVLRYVASCQEDHF